MAPENLTYFLYIMIELVSFVAHISSPPSHSFSDISCSQGEPPFQTFECYSDRRTLVLSSFNLKNIYSFSFVPSTPHQKCFPTSTPIVFVHLGYNYLLLEKPKSDASSL